jgi:hypothetical protein
VSHEDEPLEGIPVLGYAGGGAGTGGLAGQRPAFNARRRWMWTGEHLFRVYLAPEFVYFIRIGGAKNSDQLLFGVLLGSILAKERREKEVERALANDTVHLEALLQRHNKSHVFATRDISDVVIEKAGWGSGVPAKWSFRVKGENKRIQMTFDRIEDVHIAVRRLPQMFPGTRVGIEFNERKKKYVKLK